MTNKEVQVPILVPVHNGGNFPGGFDYTDEYKYFVESGKVLLGDSEKQIEISTINSSSKRINLDDFNNTSNSY